ncbi:HAD-IA family hydrolase [Hymenobacter tibetensis]|uniref:HAD-IA family hydrolase n=1 Tax=Hymenobacter tibetensis TaxID=497967 RepID=A0ABY4CRM0_9BACT|nr:HAD-IA family hydrolase [Hymenobacter tibetensis]UOG72868.1 HAD-IA family hydrolase [Hymenobacter tibetensis]
MIRTVIFDMDGVLVDTEPLHHDAFFRHFAELGITMTAEDYAPFLGSSTRNIYQRLKQKFDLPQEVDALMSRKRELFGKSFDESTELDLLPGARQLVEDLHQHGVPLVLASSASKDTIARVFNRFGLYPFFAHLVSGEDFTESKPNPAIFLHAAELAGTPPPGCLVLEDAANGVAAAKAAGMYCIGYRSEHSTGQDLRLADRVVSDLRELNAATILAFPNAANPA